MHMCTGHGGARHSRQARGQHAGPDMADLVIKQDEMPAGSNHKTYVNMVSRSRRQCRDVSCTHVTPSGTTPAPISLMWF